MLGASVPRIDFLPCLRWTDIFQANRNASVWRNHPPNCTTSAVSEPWTHTRQQLRGSPYRDVRAIYEHSTIFFYTPSERDTNFRMFHQLHLALSIDILENLHKSSLVDNSDTWVLPKPKDSGLCADVRTTFRYEKGTTLPGPGSNARSFLMHSGLFRHVDWWLIFSHEFFSHLGRIHGGHQLRS
jgi:hypothetical protein